MLTLFLLLNLVYFQDLIFLQKQALRSEFVNNSTMKNHDKFLVIISLMIRIFKKIILLDK